MAGIFISYRRTDSGGYADNLFNTLSRRFGRDRVFMDIDSLKKHAGLSFSQALDQAVSTCDVMLALIGPGWLKATDDAGNRRLDNPQDWVRQEIVAALARDGIRVIPVLVGGASLPRNTELPAELQALVERQSIVLSRGRWDDDVRDLVNEVLIREIGKGSSPLKAGLFGLSRRVTSVVAAIAAIIVTGLVTVGLSMVMRDPVDPTRGSTPAPTSQIAAVIGTPTLAPTETPTPEPTPVPTEIPTSEPTTAPTQAPTATPTLAPEPTATSTLAPTATLAPTVTPTLEPTATPTLTVDPTFAAVGLVSERAYRSPQFGFTVEWDDTWRLDNYYDPPLRSDIDAGFDQVYLALPGRDVPYVQITGLSLSSGRTLEEEVAYLGSTDYFEILSPDTTASDYTVILRATDERSGGIVALRRVEEGPNRIIVAGTSLLDDGQTAVSVFFVAHIDDLERSYDQVIEEVRLNGQPLLQVFGLDEILTALEERGETETPIPEPTAAPTLAIDIEEILNAAEGRGETETPTSEPTAAPTLDPTSEALGMVSEREYQSPRFGYTVEWDDSWELDGEFGSPLVSDDEEIDRINLALVDEGLSFMKLNGSDDRTLEGELAYVRSTEHLDLTIPGEYAVVLEAADERSGGVVVLVFGEAGVEVAVIIGSFLLDDDETVVRVYFAAEVDELERDYDRANEEVRLNGQPPLAVFDIDEILTAVEEHEPPAGEGDSLTHAWGSLARRPPSSRRVRRLPARCDPPRSAASRRGGPSSTMNGVWPARIWSRMCPPVGSSAPSSPLRTHPDQSPATKAAIPASPSRTVAVMAVTTVELGASVNTDRLAIAASRLAR